MSRPRVTELDDVLDAAAQRLASHGIADTTVDDVAEAAGVSRATIYRYVGAKDEIIQAVIAREADNVLTETAAAISVAATAHEAIAGAVSAALTSIAANPLLARLTSRDLRETLPFITTDSRALADHSIAILSDVMRTSPDLNLEDASIEPAIEESTRFVLAHLTTPRSNGTRLSAGDAGARAAQLIAPMLAPEPRPQQRT